MDIWEWIQNVKTFTLHLKVHQRACTIKGAINKHIDKMIWPDDASQPLSSATLVPESGWW